MTLCIQSNVIATFWLFNFLFLSKQFNGCLLEISITIYKITWSRHLYHDLNIKMGRWNTRTDTNLILKLTTHTFILLLVNNFLCTKKKNKNKRVHQFNPQKLIHLIFETCSLGFSHSLVLISSWNRTIYYIPYNSYKSRQHSNLAKKKKMKWRRKLNLLYI